MTYKFIGNSRKKYTEVEVVNENRFYDKSKNKGAFILEKKCQKCGKTISDTESKFCPYCGNKIEPAGWQCTNCLATNDGEASFCKKCGKAKGGTHNNNNAGNSESLPFTKYKYFKHIAITIALLIVTACGSYYYFNNMNEGRYLKLYAEAYHTLNEANSVLVSNTRQGVLTSDSASELKTRLQKEKDEIDSEVKEFTSRKPFQGYTAQHEAVIELLQKESNVLGLAIQVLNNPLDDGLDAQVEEAKETVQQIKDLSGQISVPSTVMTLDDDITVLPVQLKAYVAEERKKEEERKRIEAERQARLKELKDFFSEMDAAIDQYNNAKTNLGGMMESSRNGGMIWADYFRILNQAKSDRESVRYKVRNIKAPQGTEELKRDFLEVLDDSIRYCDVMKIGANLAFNHYYYSADQKKGEADKIDKDVQDKYASFTDQYETAKNNLL